MAAARREVALAERLQRVLSRERLARPSIAGAGERRVDHVDELAQHARGGELAVVLLRAADVAQNQPRARRCERFQERVAVVVAWRAVAGPRIGGDEIEARRAVSVRELAIVEAGDADELGGNRAHRLEAAERDRPGDEARAAARHVHLRSQSLANDLERDVLGDAGECLRAHQRVDRRAELLERTLVALAVGDDQLSERGTDVAGPALERARRAECTEMTEETIDERGEAAEQIGIAGGCATRQDAGHQRVGVPDRVAQQQTVEPGAPGVEVVAGQRELVAPMRAVDAPADVGDPHPLPHGRQLLGRDAGAAADRSGVQ